MVNARMAGMQRSGCKRKEGRKERSDSHRESSVMDSRACSNRNSALDLRLKFYYLAGLW